MLMRMLLCALVFLPAGAHADDEWIRKFMEERQARPRVQYARPYLAPPANLPGAIPRIEPHAYAVPYQRYEAVREAMPLEIPLSGRLIIVFTRFQQYSAYIDGRAAYMGNMALRGPISTGTQGRYATPLTDPQKGMHSVEYRQVDYVSKTYPEPNGGAPMPYSMFFNRAGGFALHGGPLPRWNGEPYGVSHGCVRFDMTHARILYEHFSDESVRVIIVEDVAALYQKWARVSVR